MAKQIKPTEKRAVTLLCYSFFRFCDMEEGKLIAERETTQYKQYLLTVLCRQPDKKYHMGNRDSSVWQHYALGSKDGKMLYESFSEEELLQFLRDIARELNHTPSQKEVFWVMREYIKRRFGKWPYALRLAGLSTAAGKGGASMEAQDAAEAHKNALLQQVREKAIQLGRFPHPGDMPQVCADLKKHYKLWAEVLKAAGVTPQLLNEKCVYKIEDLEPEYLAMLEEVKACAYKLGRSPAHGDVEPSLKKALITRCGSWRNALFQIGLRPVAAKNPFQNIYIDYRKSENRHSHTAGTQGCLYKVLNLHDEDKAMFAELSALYREIGRPPLSRELPKEIRSRLHKVCGSWVNALYQIDIKPEEYYKILKEAKAHGE
ncbi:hypothetical protein D1155_08325 [Anaerotruncus sp. 80]|uniref:Uncharacterized protein n=2 Tax=Oscillospiraceae TaxID=216572 RepID=A0A845QLN6_9FIRM|nr:hypothetical protein [Anaerotruncus colihominis]NCF02308.1 hypothetical protein [Anaerotruncus sp. 80]